MTSIEWLIKQLNKQGFAQVVTDEEIQQAKEIHKAEIINAYGVGMNEGCSYMTYGKTEFENREQYYNETFKKD